VPFTSGNDSSLLEGPDCNQIVLSTGHYELAIGRPTDAEETAEKGGGKADELHRIIIEDPETTILRDDSQIFGTRREGKVVDGPISNNPSTIENKFRK